MAEDAKWADPLLDAAPNSAKFAKPELFSEASSKFDVDWEDPDSIVVALAVFDSALISAILAEILSAKLELSSDLRAIFDPDDVDWADPEETEVALAVLDSALISDILAEISSAKLEVSNDLSAMFDPDDVDWADPEAEEVALAVFDVACEEIWANSSAMLSLKLSSSPSAAMDTFSKLADFDFDADLADPEAVEEALVAPNAATSASKLSSVNAEIDAVW